MMQECSNPACHCRGEAEEMVEKEGQYYCGEGCAEKPAASEPCECGHEECMEETAS